MEKIGQALQSLPAVMEFAGIIKAIEQEGIAFKKREERLQQLIAKLETTTTSSSTSTTTAATILKLNIGGKELVTRSSSFPRGDEILFLTLFKPFYQDYLLKDKNGNVFYDLNLEWFEVYFDYFRCANMFHEMIKLKTLPTEFLKDCYEQTLQYLQLQSIFTLKKENLESLKTFSSILPRSSPQLIERIEGTLNLIFHQISGKAQEKIDRRYSVIPLYITNELFITDIKSYHHLLILIEDTEGNIFGAYCDRQSCYDDGVCANNFIFPLDLNFKKSFALESELIKMKDYEFKDHICPNCSLFPFKFYSRPSSAASSDASSSDGGSLGFSSSRSHKRLELRSEYAGVAPRKWFEVNYNGEVQEFRVKTMEMYRVEMKVDCEKSYEVVIKNRLVDNRLVSVTQSAEDIDPSSGTITVLPSVPSDPYPLLSAEVKKLRDSLNKAEAIANEFRHYTKQLAEKEKKLLISLIQFEDYLLQQHIYLGLLTETNLNEYSVDRVFVEDLREENAENKIDYYQELVAALERCDRYKEKLHQKFPKNFPLSNDAKVTNSTASSEEDISDPIAYLNVGGERICILKSTIQEYLPDCHLSIRLSGRWKEQPQDIDNEGYLFLDYPKESFLQLLSTIRLQKLKKCSSLLRELKGTKRLTMICEDGTIDYRKLFLSYESFLRAGGVPMHQRPDVVDTTNEIRNQNLVVADTEVTEAVGIEVPDHEPIVGEVEDDEGDDESDDHSENYNSDGSDVDDDDDDLADTESVLSSNSSREVIDDDRRSDNRSDSVPSRLTYHRDEESFYESHYRNQVRRNEFDNSSSTYSGDSNASNSLIRLPIASDQINVMRHMLDYLGIPVSEELARDQQNTIVFKIASANGEKRRKLND